MKYTLILNDFNDTAREQISKLGHFLSDCHLSFEEGSAVVFHSHSEENVKVLESLAELMPAAHVRYVYLKQYLPELCLDYLAEHKTENELFLFPGNIWGNELCTRLSVRFGGCALTDILSIQKTDSSFLAKKKIYSGHVLGTFKLTGSPCFVSVDKNYAEEPYSISSLSREVSYDSVSSSGPYDLRLSPVVQDESFAAADCIVICGRGLSNTGNMALIKESAASLNIPLAGSRPCIMNAWLPMDRLIGVSGTALHNKLVILLGVSGAPAFYTGVEKCRRIISINTDADAPVTRKSDLAICGDCVEIFTRFSELLKEETHE